MTLLQFRGTPFQFKTAWQLAGLGRHHEKDKEVEGREGCMRDGMCILVSMINTLKWSKCWLTSSPNA
jgi:hypothetical protein